MNKYKLILASNSPRRRELLSGLGFAYELRVLDNIDESYPEDLHDADIPLYISQRKAEAYIPAMADDELVITADTIVWLNGEVLGKPVDEGDAKRMLAKLSGQTHQVYTGVTLATRRWQHSFSAATDVTFSVLTPEEIDFYVSNYKPMDKAGSYGVQEWLGYVACKHICGSFYNVMGLPVQRLYQELKKCGVDFS